MNPPYTCAILDDGLRSYDCNYCGRSFLEKNAARRHYLLEHKPKMARLAAYFRTLTAQDFGLIWAGFVMRPIPKRERAREHFQRIFLRDTFAAEVARRGM